MNFNTILSWFILIVMWGFVITLWYTLVDQGFDTEGTTMLLVFTVFAVMSSFLPIADRIDRERREHFNHLVKLFLREEEEP